MTPLERLLPRTSAPALACCWLIGGVLGSWLAHLLVPAIGLLTWAVMLGLAGGTTGRSPR